MLVQEGDLAAHRVLEVGAGTGNLAAALAERTGARVWAVDPSPEMLTVARAKAPRGVHFKLGRAERLPFRDGWFERAVMTLVVHVLDRPRAFAELRRVLRSGGRLVFATFDPAHMRGYWLNELFPSMESADLARFAPADELLRELREAGFADARALPLGQRASIDRETALAKIRGRHISTFDLIGDDEYRAGLERAERELPERIEYALEQLVVVAER